MKVEFHAIAAGGDAVGRDETGRVVFAPYGAPGDVAEVAIDEEHRGFARGHIIDLHTASPQRVAPQSPYYLPYVPHDLETACGGCQIQHLSYQAQLEAKRGIVRDALHRIGGIERDTVEALVQPCVASPLPFAYRNKADFVVTVENGTPKIGFFARGSHQVIDIQQCPIQQALNNELLAVVRTCLNEGLAPPFDPTTGRGVVRRLVTRTASDGTTLLTAATTRAAWPQAQQFVRHIRQQVPSLAGVLRRLPRQEATLIEGQDWLEEEVAGLRLRVTGEGFFQINTPIISTLVESAMQLAQVQEGQHALDLYCGVGLFSLAMAQRGARVLGIEVSRGAIQDAHHNAHWNGFDESNVLFKAGNAESELRHLSAREWDMVLLDPPRAGAAECLQELLRLQVPRIIYVSCDPATLARDIKTLTAQGYRLDTAIPLDLFPQTAHVETIVRLLR